MKMKLRVRKEFTFDASHRLPEHAGKCSNLHGHTYRLAVEVRGPIQPISSANSASGMIVDFATLKAIVRTHIINRLDHKHLCQGLPIQDNIIHDGVIRIGSTLGDDPLWDALEYSTAERMVMGIVDMLGPLLQPIDLQLVRVELWETATSCAVWDVMDEYGELLANFNAEDLRLFLTSELGKDRDAD